MQFFSQLIVFNVFTNHFPKKNIQFIYDNYILYTFAFIFTKSIYNLSWKMLLHRYTWKER